MDTLTTSPTRRCEWGKTYKLIIQEADDYPPTFPRWLDNSVWVNTLASTVVSSIQDSLLFSFECVFVNTQLLFLLFECVFVNTQLLFLIWVCLCQHPTTLSLIWVCLCKHPTSNLQAVWKLGKAHTVCKIFVRMWTLPGKVSPPRDVINNIQNRASEDLSISEGLITVSFNSNSAPWTHIFSPDSKPKIPKPDRFSSNSL